MTNFSTHNNSSNNNSSNNNRSGGIGFFGLLTIAFIVLKLCGIIDWMWLWVFAPLWIPVALAIVLGLAAIITGSIIDLIDVIDSAQRDNNRKRGN